MSETMLFNDVFKRLGLTDNESKQFSEHDKKVKTGIVDAVTVGAALHSIQVLVSKPGVKGGFSAYLRDRRIVRQTAYRWLAEYKWSCVPDELKNLAKDHTDISAVRNVLILQSEAASDKKLSESELKAKIAQAVAEEPDSTGDAIADAVKRAANVLVAAFKGKLHAVANIEEDPDFYATKPEAAMQNLSHAMSQAARKATEQLFFAISQEAEKRPALKKLIPTPQPLPVLHEYRPEPPAA